MRTDTTVTAADPLSVLRTRTSEKWSRYSGDVLPMFIAEMDFPLAPAIGEALGRALERGDTGYVNPLKTGARDAFAAFAEDSWGWSPAVSSRSSDRWQPSWASNMSMRIHLKWSTGC